MTNRPTYEPVEAKEAGQYLQQALDACPTDPCCLALIAIALQAGVVPEPYRN